MTIDGLLPVMVAPFFTTELVDSIAVYCGTAPAGGALLPPGDVHEPPQVVGPAGEFEKPLNAVGAAPPLTVLSVDQLLPQNVTLLPTAELPLPTAKFPPFVQSKMIVAALADDGR